MQVSGVSRTISQSGWYGFRVPLFLIFTILLSGCSTDISINDDVGTMPVVYGIIDPWSDANVLYVSKTALIEGNVYQSANQPNFFCPGSVSVRMEMWNDTLLLWYTDFHQIKRDKQPGLFAEGNALVLESDKMLPKRNESDSIAVAYPDFQYFRFVISSPDFLEPAYARIDYARPVSILKPYFSDQNVRLYGPEPLLVSWPVDEHFKYFDLLFNVRYTEITDKVRNSSVSFCYSHDVQAIGDEYEVQVEPDKFLNQLSMALSRDTLSCQKRRLVNFDIVLAAGDANFENYLVQARFESVVYQKPWSNIVNGIGLIALKSQSSKEGLRFHPETIDSLAMGRFTKQFRFVRW